MNEDTTNLEELSIEEEEARLAERKKQRAENENKELLNDVFDIDALLDEVLTETGNAETFIDSLDGRAKHIIELNKWAYWGGEKWNINDDAEIERKFKAVIECLKGRKAELEAMRIPLVTKAEPTDADKETIKKINGVISRVRKWITASLKLATKTASIKIASTIEGVPIEYREFDKKGHFFGVANGVVDLRDGSLVSDRPEYMLLKSSEVPYDVEAECPHWEKFIADITCGDQGKIDLLQMIAGSAMVGNVKDKMFFFNGDGSNGKSTFVTVLSKILGEVDKGGYKASVSPETITGASTSEQSYALARLKGVRLIVMNELGAGDGRSSKSGQLDDTIVKRMVDSDEGLQARPIRGEPFEFNCIATMILNTNHVPSVATTDGGIWRRLCLVNFERVFTDAEKDRTLVADKLMPELSGILRWCVDGAMAYMGNNQQFIIPDSIVADNVEWRASEDKLGSFIGSRLIGDVSTKIKITDLLAEYDVWCKERGFHAGGEKELIKKLKQRGMDVSNSYNGGVNHLRGYMFTNEGNGMVINHLMGNKKKKKEVKTVVDLFD